MTVGSQEVPPLEACRAARAAEVARTAAWLTQATTIEKDGFFFFLRELQDVNVILVSLFCCHMDVARSFAVARSGVVILWDFESCPLPPIASGSAESVAIAVAILRAFALRLVRKKILCANGVADYLFIKGTHLRGISIFAAQERLSDFRLRDLHVRSYLQPFLIEIHRKAM